MSTAFLETVTSHFENVTDPRANRGHNDPLIEMVFVALCGAICDWDESAFERLLAGFFEV